MLEFQYKEADNAWSENQKNVAKLEESYQGILDRQQKYNIQLVGNEAFFEWTTSDFSTSWYAKNNPDAEPPKLDNDMIHTFVEAPNGSGMKRLKDIDDVDDAIRALYWFRENHGLEDSYYAPEREYWKGKDVYCSNQSYELNEIYSQYINQNAYDYRA